MACGKCLQCRIGQAHICQHVKILGVDANGAFASYVIIPETNIWKLSPTIPRDWCSLLDPLGNAVHTVLAGDIAARTVIVTGCGAIGLFSIAVAKACGAARVFAVEVNAHRRAVAATMGADLVLDPAKDNVEEQILDATGGTGVDVLLEMSGHPAAIELGFSCAENRRTRIAAGNSVKASGDGFGARRSSSKALRCRASTDARCTKLGFRWRLCWPAAS